MDKKIRVNVPIKNHTSALFDLLILASKEEIDENPNGWALPYVKKLECYHWCEVNCSGNFSFVIVDGTFKNYTYWLNVFYFEFEDKNDATAFKVIFG